MNKRDAQKLSPMHILGISVIVVCLTGAYLAYTSSESLSKLERAIGLNQRELNRMQRPESAGQLSAQLQEIEDSLEQNPEGLAARRLIESSQASGIELGTAIQEYIHEFGTALEQAGIQNNEQTLGFDDFAREVAILSEERQIQIPSVELGMLKLLMPMVIDSAPISLETVTRLSTSTEIPGQKIVDPKSGYLVDGPPSFRHDYRVSLVMDGYTRSLRSLLNALNQTGNPLVITGLTVRKSEKSEADNVSDFLQNNTSRSIKKQQPSPSRSPFAQYIQVEDDSEGEKQTKPLIGEVVSRFKIEVKLHTGGQQ
jgi:Tfp pilus assembly protein PilN